MRYPSDMGSTFKRKDMGSTFKRKESPPIALLSPTSGRQKKILTL